MLGGGEGPVASTGPFGDLHCHQPWGPSGWPRQDQAVRLASLFPAGWM